MIQPEEQPYPSRRYGAYVVSVLGLAFFMSYLDRQIVTLLLPSLRAGLSISDTQVSLIQGMAFASVYVFAGLPMGWIADHANRRNLIVGGITFWTLATLACGFAQNFWQLFAARMAVALGEACLSPAAVSLMADYFRPAQRGRTAGLMMTGAPIGSAASLFLGGMLLTSLTHGAAAAMIPQDWAPWQIVFLAIASPGLLVAILVATLKEPPRRSDVTISPLGDAQVRLVDFFRKNSATLALFYSVVGCTALLSFSVASWAPTMLMRVYGMAPTQAGGIFGGILLIAVISGVCSGFISDGFVRRWPLVGRALIPLIVFPIEIVAQTTLILTTSPVVVVVALAVSVCNMGLIGTSFYPALQDLFPNHLRGRAFAVLTLIGSVVGMGCGPTLVALVTDHVFHDEMMLQKSIGLVAFSAAILGLLLSLALPHLYGQARRRELQPQPIAPLMSVDTAAACSV
jgi:MFS family permease